VRCEECGDKPHKAFHLGTSVTLMGWLPYTDETGAHHAHNPNKHTDGFRCSNGHSWTRERYVGCPACGYKDKP
jgi:hypothetical protein